MKDFCCFYERSVVRRSKTFMLKTAAWLLLSSLIMMQLSCYLSPRRSFSGTFTKEIIERCDEIAREKCNMSCFDGIGRTRYFALPEPYYDEYIKDLDNNRLLVMKHGLLIGQYTTMVCKECHVSFIIYNYKENATCEEFFNYMVEYEKVHQQRIVELGYYGGL